MSCRKLYSHSTKITVKNKEFRDLLGRLRTGKPTEQDAEIILNLHISLYESDIAFMDYLKNNKKTMWLYT